MFTLHNRKTQITSIMAIAIVSAACTPQEPSATPTLAITWAPLNESPILSPPASVVDTPKPTPTFTPFPTPTQIPTVTLLPTSIPQPPSTEEWATYVHPEGASIQYPAGWQTNAVTQTSTVRFESSVDTIINPNYVIHFDVFTVPLEHRSIADPYTWPPNEGMYEVQWSKPISIKGAAGVEFIWGRYEGSGRWDGRPWLYAIYYSEQCELEIMVGTLFDDKSLEMIESAGFAEVVSSRFGVFEHMAESVRILRE